MNARLHTVALDCPDPDALAEFYSQLLGLPVTRRSRRWVVVGEEWPRLAFQHAPDHRPPDWPDPERPQQVHLDIWVEDIEAAETRALALGARRLAVAEEDPEDLFRVYADPAGHPFCLEYGG
ncbi:MULTISPECIES: VOC family protein [unclassified Nocardiopsis]|uniref:VOC family protein n=1 Tax=unclassified Nocardiopsis TaxID=2649073 RepID=UPI00135CCCDA|nr:MULTISPECIES: VOC family protein [unclassified Nocardiopsis]